MTANGWAQILFFSLVVLLITKPVGLYLVKVYDGSFRWLAPMERFIYRVIGIDPDDDQHWTHYAASTPHLQRGHDAGDVSRAAAAACAAAQS